MRWFGAMGSSDAHCARTLAVDAQKCSLPSGAGQDDWRQAWRRGLARHLAKRIGEEENDEEEEAEEQKDIRRTL